MAPEERATAAPVHLLLVVDDDESARYAKSRILRWAGYEVIEASNGADALALVRARHPSIVLLDVKLPDLSGTEVCRTIKADPVLETLVLQTSATFTSAAHRIEGLNSGADGYLPQPAEPEELLANVRALLRIKEAERRWRDSEAKLRETDRQKDVFLATLSHELRNPLAPMLTAAELLGHPRLAPPQLAWVQSVIRRQVGHMAGLLDDLLDVARITQGKLELKRERVSLERIVDVAVEAVRPLIDRRRHRLTVTLPSEVPTLDGDPIRLAQILTNLLTNAAKYTDPDGRIDLRARVENGMLALDVEDDGIGMTPEAISTVFEMFSQVDSHSQRSEGGLGIGLALVKGLVDLHGGSIQARSPGPGFGSVFTLRLAITTAPPAAAESMNPPPRAPGCRRVLIADDNRDAADSLAMILSLSGHTARTAYDGAAALTLAQEFRPEVAILDIGMPGMDGYALARTLRRADWSKNLSLIALTGWGQDEDKLKARAAGFHAHLTKPVDAQSLQSLLADLQSARPAAPS